MDNLGLTTLFSTFHEFYLSAQSYLFRFISPRSFRLLLILSIYLIVRPYLLKGGAKHQAREHEKAVSQHKKVDGPPVSPGTPQFSGPRIVELEDSDSDEEMSRKDGGKAKRRQLRRTMQEIVEDKGEARGQAGTDEEIENLLRSSVK